MVNLKDWEQEQILPALANNCNNKAELVFSLSMKIKEKENIE
jgi:hypothetical protein